MGHMMKVKGGNSKLYGLMKIHNDRTQEDPEHKLEKDRSNKNIDPTRSHLNYNLIDRQDIYTYAKDRLEEIEKEQKEATGRGFRKDAVRACSLVVYLPEEKEAKGEKYEKEFFKGCVDYMKEQFGEKNILQAIVHKDENRPHIHIVAIPTTRDERGKEHLNYKEAFTRKDYNRLHPELERHTQARTHDRTIKLYDPLKEKTKTVSKERYILRDEMKKLEKEREEIAREREKLEQERKELERAEKKKEEAERKLQQEHEKLKKNIEEHNKQVLKFNKVKEQIERQSGYFEARESFIQKIGSTPYEYEKAIHEYEKGQTQHPEIKTTHGTYYAEPELKNPFNTPEEKKELERNFQKWAEPEKKEHDRERQDPQR